MGYFDCSQPLLPADWLVIVEVQRWVEVQWMMPENVHN